jgi:hypothetical protein
MASKNKSKSKPESKKTQCPVSRKEFNDAAAQVLAEVGGQCVGLDPREFSTGSIGWYHNGKINIRVGDKVVVAQANLTLTVVNSKELPR